MDVTDGAESLAEAVRRLQCDTHVRRLVDERVTEFIEVNRANSFIWFVELVYCLLTAYSSAERGQLCVDALDDCGAILHGSIEEVAETLRKHGHRFADRRAEYIVAARRLAPTLKETIMAFGTSGEGREWLVRNVKGLGWKEASHFLRNVGYLDVAILDRHILSSMRDHDLIHDDARKGLTKKRYLEYENVLRTVADRLRMPIGHMDLYLWYMKTGKVLK